MTEAYRQKLLHWWCSISLVLLFAAMSPLLYWFTGIPGWIENFGWPDAGMLPVLLVGPLLVYPVVFPFVIFWHFWDFFQTRAPLGPRSSALSNYMPFSIALITVNSLMIVLTNQVFTTDSCETMKGVYHFECIIQEPMWLSILALIIGVIAIFLCVAKAVITVAMRLGAKL